jgi:hypothetical protein
VDGDLHTRRATVDLEHDGSGSVGEGVRHELGDEEPGDVDRLPRQVRTGLVDVPARHTCCRQV